MQLLLDAGFVSARRPTSNPRPSLHQQLSVLAICLEVDRCDYLVAEEHRQSEITKHPLLLRDIGLETVLVIEEELEPLALNDQRVERRKDMNETTVLFGSGIEGLRSGKMLGAFRTFDRDRNELPAPQPLLDDLTDGRFSPGIEMADEIENSRSLVRVALGQADTLIPVSQRPTPGVSPTQNDARSAHRSSACRYAH